MKFLSLWEVNLCSSELQIAFNVSNPIRKNKRTIRFRNSSRALILLAIRSRDIYQIIDCDL